MTLRHQFYTLNYTAEVAGASATAVLATATSRVQMIGYNEVLVNERIILDSLHISTETSTVIHLSAAGTRIYPRIFLPGTTTITIGPGLEIETGSSINVAASGSAAFIMAGFFRTGSNQ